MKLSAKTLADDIKNVKLSAELQKFYDENVAEMVDLYGEDETIDKMIDEFVGKANAYLAKNEKPAAQPQKPETKEDKPKKESKNDETRPEPKKEEPKPAEPKAEKPKKEPKAPKAPKKKAPKALFKTGAWVIDNSTEQAGVISERLNYDDERGWLYHIEYVGSNRQSLVKESDLSATRKPRTVATTGELVPELSAEIKIISRYLAMDGKKVSKLGNEPRLCLAALQKMIINKQIRKTSRYAKEINAMQDSLIKLVNSRADGEVVIAHADELRKIVARQNVSEISNISRQFVLLIGKPNKKKEAKALYEKLLKYNFKGSDSDEAATMRKALKAYISDENETVYATARELQGIFGLAGL